MITEVFFDCETKTLFTTPDAISSMGVSIVSVYVRKLSKDMKEIEGKMISFWEHQLPDMWEIMRSADRIIGFNSLSFDVPVLLPYAPKEFALLPHFDLLQELRKKAGFRASLNNLSKHTLGREKNDSGINAVLYWSRRDSESLENLQKYCEMDVALTRDLYDHARIHGHLVCSDKQGIKHKVPLDFSYSEKFLKNKLQQSLF